MAGVKGFESSNVGFSWGRRLKGSGHKTEAMSRRSGSTSQLSRGFMSQRHDVETSVMTFHKGESATS